jgi:CheY-like chemotaxis protein
MTESILPGRSVLVVEDEYFFADALQSALRQAGATVLGPVPSVEAALELLEREEEPQAAVLDVNLGGEMVHPVADALLARGIPFVFATGYDPSFLPERHGSIRWLTKPCNPSVVLMEVERLLSRDGTPGDAAMSLPNLRGAAPLSISRNSLIERLPDEDRLLILPLLERVTLRRGDVLHERSQHIRHVYFPEGGLSSEIAVNPDGNQIEVGCVGCEGLSGAPVLLGVEQARHKSFMEVGGTAVRIASRDLQSAVASSRSLHNFLLRYVHVFMIQIAATALADGRYQIQQRLARWLLMAHDRLGGDELPLTHEFLALMLGVQRSGLTGAIHVPEGEGAIRAKRARITVRDRAMLEAIAGDSYGAPEAEYRRLFGNTSFPPQRGTLSVQAAEARSP